MTRRLESASRRPLLAVVGVVGAAAVIATVPSALEQPASGATWALAVAAVIVGLVTDRVEAVRVGWPVAALVWLQLLVFPLPGGVWFLGLLLGLLTALVALGMALIYRANRILNFAQADLGTAPTVLAVGLVSFSNLSWFLAVPIGLATALVLGALIETLIIRRFAKAPRLILTVATIGLSQLLTVVGVLLPRLWGEDLLTDELDIPWTFRFTIDPLRFTADHVLAIVAVPLALIALVGFLRFTAIGVAVRAAAESRDRAALLGVPVRRLQTVVWVVAALLSFLGVLLRASIVGLPVVSTLSVAALLSAVAALMLGNLTNLPAVAASAAALGILEQGIIWNNPEDTNLVFPIFGAVVLVALIVRRGGRSRAETDSSASWRSAEEIRPVPAELRKLPEVRAARYGSLAVLGAIVLALPAVVGPSTELRAATLAVFVIIAASIVVLTGWAGQVSLGQMSFVAVGAAVGAVATGEWRVDLSLALLVSGTAGAVVAVLVGLPALRLRGLFLAVTTLAFAIASTNYLLNRTRFSWLPRGSIERGRLFAVFDLTSQASIYYVCVVVAMLSLVVVRGVRAGRTGRTLLAVRDNDRAVQAYGVAATRTKLAAFALSGFLAAVAGCLHAQVLGLYSESVYAPTESFGVFTAAVVGGLGSLLGAVLGAVFLNGGEWFLNGDWRLLPSAIGVLFVLLVLPGGLGHLFYRGRDALLRRVAARRGLVVPSLVADVRTEPVGGPLGAAVVGEDTPARIAPPAPAGAPASAESSGERRADQQKLLVVRDLDVSYGDVQILFGVDFEVGEGEIVALLGTNGAGKSTLLNAISGVVQANRGAVMFDGRDVTHAPPEQIARTGISQVPGGRGVFPGLTVAENLRVAGWMFRGDKATTAERLAQTEELFPVLAERREHPAADLSGGQQQMLGLSMAFLSRPRLLVIDELSLGLAPVVVDQLLGIVRAMCDEGTTIILVEQSVDVALTVAETAYFMEKGEIRFHGPTAELLERPDVLRSVFLEGAVAGLAAQDGRSAPASTNGAGRARTTPPRAGSAHGPASPDTTATPLEVAGLTVRFGGIMAVDGVDLRLARGEILGVIGPNGAGKTTLFDLISGFTPIDSGQVRLDGRDVTRATPATRARAGLGRSFQDSQLFPTLTVEETISVALDRWVGVRDPFNAILHTPAFVDSEVAVADEVDRLIDLMGIESFRTKFVHELSTGSRRVVDLACVLAHRPTVVLLDEPSSGIAQRETEALAPLLLRIRDVLGASLVVIEHEMPLITSVSDRMIALDQGHLVAEGRPDEVLAHPEVVASYLGTRDAIARSSTLETAPSLRRPE